MFFFPSEPVQLLSFVKKQPTENLFNRLDIQILIKTKRILRYVSKIGLKQKRVVLLFSLGDYLIYKF